MGIKSTVKSRIKRITPKPVWEAARKTWFGGKRRVRGLKKSLQKPIRLEKLVSDLRKGGLKKGDLVCIYTSMNAMGKVEGGAETVLKAFQEALGPEGTLMMSAFLSPWTVFENYKKGEMADLRNAEGYTGVITELFRKMPGVLRSSHPFSSMVVKGPLAESLVRDHAKDPHLAHWGSPLGKLVKLNGKVLCFGTDMDPIGVFMVLEDCMEGFPFETHLPPVSIGYMDADGKKVVRDIVFTDPESRHTRIDQPGSGWIRRRLGEHMIKKGIRKDFKFGRANAFVLNAGDLYDEMARLARKGVTIFLTENEWGTDRDF